MAKPTLVSDWHSEPVERWPGLKGSQQDFGGLVYISNDREWIWRNTPSGVGADWTKNIFSSLPESAVNTNQTAPIGAQERIGHMLFNITVVKKAVSNVATNAIVEPEKILVPQDQVTAMEQNAAILAFGAKHADKLEDVAADSLLVYVRQGA